MATSKDVLIASTNAELAIIDAAIQGDRIEANVHGNWPGTSGVALWDDVAKSIRPVTISSDRIEGRRWAVCAGFTVSPQRRRVVQRFSSARASLRPRPG